MKLKGLTTGILCKESSENITSDHTEHRIMLQILHNFSLLFISIDVGVKAEIWSELLISCFLFLHVN